MKKYDRNEDEIIRLLGRMPDVKDRRNKKEVISGLSAVRRRGRSRNSRRKWVPAIMAAAAALLIFSVLAASLLRESELDHSASDKVDSGSEKKSMIMNKSSDRDTAARTKENAAEPEKGDISDQAKSAETAERSGRTDESSAKPDTESKETNDKGDKQAAELSSHYSSDNASGYVTVGVPDEQMNFTVPVTLRSPAEADSFAEKIKAAMAALDETALGLSEYYPLDAVFIDGPEEGTLKVDIPAGSKLLEMDETFISSLIETMKYNSIKTVYFFSEGEPGAEFAHYGRLEKQETAEAGRKAYFLYKGSSSENRFLVPSNISYDSIEEALAALKDGPGIEGALPSVPPELSWGKSIRDGDVLILPFREEETIQDDEAYSLALEAILLTAKDFGYRAVRFENVPDASVRFKMDEDIEVPDAPNKLE